MFKRIVFSVLSLILFVPAALAQEAMIIEVTGQVMVRPDSQSDWQDAEVDMLLSAEAEIKTTAEASCTLSFDDNNKNIVKIQANTTLTIESVLPGKIYLPQGRVFTLIKDLDESENFEVHTPKAVSGARGTGWLTEVSDGVTHISCFDDEIFVNSVDADGEVTGQIDLFEGSEIQVENEAVSNGDIKDIKEADKQEWQGFVHGVQKLPPPTERIDVPNATLPTTGLPIPQNKVTENFRNMMKETQQRMKDNPEKLAQFEQMIKEGRERFGVDFERMYLNGGEGDQAFSEFMKEWVQKFTDQFGKNDLEVRKLQGRTIDPANPGRHPQGPAPIGGPGVMMPPPNGGYPPPPNGDMLNPDPNQTVWYDPNIGFDDAKKEVNQTLIETNIAMCGHACCPFPQCCNIFPPLSVGREYCLRH
jgi:hypothetical protein